MRKHLKSRRLESVSQVGDDRIVDFQFGSNEAAYHIILELYDRGNIVLTDYEYVILSILRPRTDDSQDVRFAVREKYPLELAKQPEGIISAERLLEILKSAKEGENIKKVLLPHLVYGPALIEHCLLSSGLSINARIGKDISTDTGGAERLLAAFEIAESLMQTISSGTSKGYIIQQREKKSVMVLGQDSAELLTYNEFHPFLFQQHQNGVPYVEFESFDKAVDEFFSKVESQKADVRLLQKERAALKKLENVKTDHVKRLEELQSEQASDMHKAQLIEINLTLVDRAISAVRGLLASQLDWLEIEKLVTEAAAQGDPIASTIKSLKLQTNHITMLLHPKGPPVPENSDNDSDGDGDTLTLKPTKVDIDLGLSAYANARKYFTMKRSAAQKQQKTIDASEKALKSAERKIKQELKDVHTVATINKARKTYWFEKFLWCISSENYLIIGGRDQQQNEVIVKRYLLPGDLYVHADLHGASSVVIKNPTKQPVPPKTLNEAGTMALCYSAAWDAKVITSAWWVYHDQVSKTAPTGEYLTTGSFMIRGKKNFLSPSYLIYGFGFLFKVDDESMPRHKDERRVKTVEEEEQSSVSGVPSVSEPDVVGANLDDVMEEDSDGSDSSDSETRKPHADINVFPQDSDSAADGLNCAVVADMEQTTGSKCDQLTEFTEAIPCGVGKALSEQCTTNDSAEGPVKAEKKFVEFPDTSIRLQFVSGDKVTLQASAQGSASGDQDQGDDSDDDRIYLGDDKPVVFGDKSAGKQGNRLSAKQKRELKKMRSGGQKISDATEIKASVDELDINDEDIAQSQENVKSAKSQPVQLKRGQKSKLKKIQEKYADQDEEERQLRLQLLASAGTQKEDAKSKKGKKGKEAKTGNKQGMRQQQRLPQAAEQKRRQAGVLTISDITEEIPLSTDIAGTVPCNVVSTDPVGAAELDDEDDSTLLSQDAAVLDSLTSIPVAEDNLLFCIPVCAPYATMTNYRYKVKLVPGTTRRGKAAKTALDMFLHDKTATQREKDLLRSVKDTDLSRNMPGKVKVSAPNLLKSKHK